MVDVRASAASRSDEYPRWTVEQQLRRISLALVLVAWLPVHDSIALELPTALVEETQQIAVDLTDTVPAGFGVPLKVEVKASRTWANCKVAMRCHAGPGELRVNRGSPNSPEALGKASTWAFWLRFVHCRWQI